MKIQWILFSLASLLIYSMTGYTVVSSASPAHQLVIKTDKVYDPEKLSLDSINDYAKNFTFDWSDAKTVAPNKNKIQEIAAFIDTHPDYSTLTNSERLALGKIFYQLGTYYLHVNREPDKAIATFNLAKEFLPKQDPALNNQLAYAYQINYAANKLASDKQKVFLYTNTIINHSTNTKNKELAFAYSVQGMMEMTTENNQQAETLLRKSIDIYDHLPQKKDDQYARSKNALGMLVLTMNGRDEEAITLLEETKKYWSAQIDTHHNIDAAKNLISLAKAYAKVGKPLDGRDELTKAIAIYKAVYGNNSEKLMEPYQLLADTYKQIGDKKLADAYQIKVNELDKS